jgi:hypothetical protein
LRIQALKLPRRPILPLCPEHKESSFAGKRLMPEGSVGYCRSQRITTINDKVLLQHRLICSELRTENANRKQFPMERFLQILNTNFCKILFFDTSATPRFLNPITQAVFLSLITVFVINETSGIAHC